MSQPMTPTNTDATPVVVTAPDAPTVQADPPQPEAKRTVDVVVGYRPDGSKIVFTLPLAV